VKKSKAQMKSPAEIMGLTGRNGADLIPCAFPTVLATANERGEAKKKTRKEKGEEGKEVGEKEGR